MCSLMSICLLYISKYIDFYLVESEIDKVRERNIWDQTCFAIEYLIKKFKRRILNEKNNQSNEPAEKEIANKDKSNKCKCKELSTRW